MILTSHTQWWQMLLCLTVALVLTTAIGFERQLRQKSAGMRTHSLVGLGAALFMIVSKYGFADVLVPGVVRLDPSRVAAQIVSGIGFIGAGLVFVRRNKVRGLTTAASIWLAAAVGTAAGAGLVLPATFVTVAHFFIAYLYPWVTSKTLMHGARSHTVSVRYIDGTGALRSILRELTRLGFQIQAFDTHRTGGPSRRALGEARFDPDEFGEHDGQVEVEMETEGLGPVQALAERVSAVPGVVGIRLDDDGD